MTNNSPSKVLSRNLHGNYFDSVADYQLRTWMPSIYIHINKCQHIKCKYYKELMDKNILSLMSFRFNEEYIKFLQDGKINITL